MTLSPKSIKAFSHQESLPIISADFPHFGKQKKLVQEIYFSAPEKQSGILEFNCFKYNSDTDSIHIYGQRQLPLKLKSGAAVYPQSFGPNSKNSFVAPAFYNVLRRNHLIPAGNYRLYIVFTTDSGQVYRKTLLLRADSTLSAASPVAAQLNNEVMPASGSGKPGIARQAINVKGTAASTAIARSTGRIKRLLRNRGLNSRTEERAGKTLINLWYEDWFVGRYELESGKSAASQIEKQKQRVSGNVSSLAGNDLENYRSLFSQVRELNKNTNEEKELKGELSVSGNWSNGQPEYSAQDNNFYEVRGAVEAEVLEMPVSLEGYYTTQDAHRNIKASYIRAHYDADKAKAKLMKLITGYRNQFSQTAAKGKGLDQVYGSYLGSLQGNKNRLVAEISREAGLNNKPGESLNTGNLQFQIEAALEAKMKDTAGLMNKAESLDSSGKLRRKEERARAIKDSASRLYDRAMKRYEEVKALEEKYEKYQALLNQYRNTTYFDSALAYNKIKDLKDADAMSYKQLAKSASGLLPEGKAKTFMAGLTNLDAGIFPKYVSKYTMAGQQLKGLDVGYDIGFATLGMTLGSTEYAGRNGTLEKYTTYSGRMLFTPMKGQHASLVYYGYTPSRNMLKGDDFFKNTDISLPTFRQPVHIMSVNYEGTIAKNVNVDAEAATSFRNGSDQAFKNAFDADRIAWHLNAEGKIPATPLSATGSYEHGGKDFQNSTLPITISGSDLYKAGLKGEFFRSFLSAGLEFNHMTQNRFNSTGGNNRWGFTIATHSKQYPSVSLSYKPFATFRTYNDTLAIPQRPLQGAVWSGKASYQIKQKGGVSYRFNAILNKSISHSDTVSYSSDLIQFNAIYTDKKRMLMASAGQSMLTTSSDNYGSDTLNPAHVKTNFLMMNGGFTISKGISISGGGDIGFALFGFSKWGINGGVNYSLKKVPLSLRASARYSAYRLAGYSGAVNADNYGTEKSTPMSWRQLVNGNLELVWRFRMQLKDPQMWNR